MRLAEGNARRLGPFGSPQPRVGGRTRSRAEPLGAALVGLTLAACAPAAAPGRAVASPPVPAELRVPDGHRAFLRLPARGVQVYACRARAAEPGAFEWAFVAPEAALADEDGAPFGTHFAGPSWEAADGSRAVGEVRARADAPVPGAIPWLLLAARSTGREGALARAVFIHRVATAGGVAPAAGCDAGRVGEEARVGYTADYVFYEATR